MEAAQLHVAVTKVHLVLDADARLSILVRCEHAKTVSWADKTLHFTHSEWCHKCICSYQVHCARICKTN